MLRRKKIGLVIWGTIFLILAFGMFGTNESFGFALGLIFLAGAILMLTFGIINIVSVTKHNKTLLAQNIDYRCQCPSCGKDIQARIQDFRPHGRYPEGFIYCPICKKPISKNAFRPFKQEENGWQ